jgi:hypothetical protein
MRLVGLKLVAVEVGQQQRNDEEPVDASVALVERRSVLDVLSVGIAEGIDPRAEDSYVVTRRCRPRASTV